MVFRGPRLICVVCALALSCLGAGESGIKLGAMATGACTDSEHWDVHDAVPQQAFGEFKDYLKGNLSFPRSFSEALAFRQLLNPGEGGAFSEYWAGRTLFGAGLQHMAVNVFLAVLGRPSEAYNAGIQAAALQCLGRIKEGVPSARMPDRMGEKIVELYGRKQWLSEDVRKALWPAAGIAARDWIARRYPEKQVAPLLKVLAGSGAEEKFTAGLDAFSRSRSKKAAEWFAAAISGPSAKHLERYASYLYLLLGRAYYDSGQFTEAATAFNHVDRRSNEFSLALVGAAWAYYREERYEEAIGISTSLRVGGMNHIFAPESPMIMAMALNELCQFPDALKAMNIFRRDYEAAYRWLSDKTPRNYYHLAVAYVKDPRKAATPHKIASEWLRSPFFISRQDELNLLIEERSGVRHVGSQATDELGKMTRELLVSARDIRQELKRARAKAEPGAPVPEKILNDLKSLQTKVVHLNRFRAAGPVWRSMMQAALQSVDSRQSELVAAINADLKAMSATMKAQLDQVMENTQLVEAEIFSGASQDVVWQNAHPDYKAMAANLGARRNEDPAAKVWDWGKMDVTDQDGGEVWEDELGAFKANVIDNCESREKYLAIKKSERLERARELRKQLEDGTKGD